MEKSFRLPKKINVYGTEYKIERRNLICNDGEYCRATKTITIDSALRDEQSIAFAFMHEVGHAIVHETGIYEALDDAVEEIMLTSTSKFWSKYFFKK